MKKVLIWLVIILGVLFLLGLVLMPIMKSQTKKHSPEETVNLSVEGTDFSIFYNRPYKKGRAIFGDLVPYNEVWRTGANEPTTFSTSKPVNINNQVLAAGEYTLWTIPGPEFWEVIFNNKQYGWGVNFSLEASRDPEADALKVRVPVEAVEPSVEQFTITLDQTVASDSLPAQVDLSLVWDKTKVVVPIKL